MSSHDCGAGLAKQTSGPWELVVVTQDHKDLARRQPLADRRQTGLLPLSRQTGPLARLDRRGQTLGAFADTTLVRSTGGPVFVAYGTLDLPGTEKMFYVILSDAPLTQAPQWVLILTWTSRTGRSDILEAADFAGGGGLNARAPARQIGERLALRHDIGIGRRSPS